MKKKLRLASLLAGAAIIAAACGGSGATTAPASSAPESAAPAEPAAAGAESPVGRGRGRRWPARSPVAQLRLGRRRDRRLPEGAGRDPAPRTRT